MVKKKEQNFGHLVVHASTDTILLLLLIDRCCSDRGCMYRADGYEYRGVGYVDTVGPSSASSRPLFYNFIV